MDHGLNHDYVVADVRGDTRVNQLNFLCFNLESSDLAIKFFSLIQIRIV